MSKPVVALVGRPNVGKSTLFNRLAGERLAVVDDRPGTTRDRLVAEALWNGVAFDIVDTGGIDPHAGRGREPLSLNSADYVDAIRAQAEQASAEADAVLFLVDGPDGPTPADHEVAGLLRRIPAPPPIFLVVNKCDSPEFGGRAVEFYELGMGDPAAGQRHPWTGHRGSARSPRGGAGPLPGAERRRPRRRAAHRHRRATQCRQVEPAQPAAGRRAGAGLAPAGDDARRRRHASDVS